jgi:hypothetical protein
VQGLPAGVEDMCCMVRSMNSMRSVHLYLWPLNG